MLVGIPQKVQLGQDITADTALVPAVLLCRRRCGAGWCRGRRG